MLTGSVPPTGPVRNEKSETYLSNRLLMSLPAHEYQRLRPYLKPINVSAGQRLHTQDELLEHVFFPAHRCVCSVTVSTSDGGTVQVVNIGSEGFVGTNVVWGGRHAAGDVTIHLPGDGLVALAIAPFLRALEGGTLFSKAVTTYVDAALKALMKNVACNAMHSAEQRCSRWLLETADRAESTQLRLTQDYMAAMLGVRRPTVTLACSALQKAGAISYQRRVVTILDRRQLEAAACGCYEAPVESAAVA